MEQDRMLMNSNWLFCKTDDFAAAEMSFDDSTWEKVTLPHDWQILNAQWKDMPYGGTQGFFPRGEVGWYRCRFIAPEDWKDRVIRVLFDGIQRFSTVYLNGKPVGGRKYGYIPVLVTLDNLNYGSENVLAVRVDNASNGGDRWYSGCGIYRNVWLLNDAPAHIAHDGVWVRCDPEISGPVGDRPDAAGALCPKAETKVTVDIEGNMEGMEVMLTVFRKDETVLALSAPAKEKTEFAFDLTNPLLWTPSVPNLYHLSVILTKDGIEYDRQSLCFGVRKAVFDDEDGFILNGVKTKLWGVNFHHDGAAFGAAVPEEIWRRRFRMAKKLGINAVRCSHNPMAEEFYDLADEMGLLVIDEYCDKWQHANGMYFDQIDDEERLEEIELMLRRDRNHPSVILWSVGNEVCTQYSEYFFETLEKLVSKVREVEPTRPVTCVLQGFCVENFNDATPLGVKMAVARRYAGIVDVFCGNYMEQMYEKMRESGMRKPIIGTEVRTYYRHDSRTMNTTDVSYEDPYSIVKRYDWVCGAFVWAGCDYLGESTWPARGWTGNLMDSTAYPKLRARYCESFFKNEPVLKLAVYDESEPWDMAAGMWGFPQMRAHWKYLEYGPSGKVLEVAVMTNCDMVKLYLNNQTPRTAYLSDFPDGMIHMRVRYVPGVLRAEGYFHGVKVAEDTLYSDVSGEEVKIELTPMEDGDNYLLTDIWLLDKHANPYVLENPMAQVTVEGTGILAVIDNGDALLQREYKDISALRFHNGHLFAAIRKTGSGKGKLTVKAEGFDAVSAEFDF